MEGREWTHSEIRYLIKLYKRQRLLYDMNDRAYTNPRAREKAINRIAKEMCPYRPNTTPTAVKEKIRSLRAQFIAENHNQQQIIDEGNPQEYEPRLWCYSMLQFLKSPSMRLPTSNTVDKCEPNIEYNEAENTDVNIEEIACDSRAESSQRRRQRRQARREDNERYRDKQHNVESIEMVDVAGYRNNFKGKKGAERLRKKQERALIAIQLAKQFACKYSQKQKASKNLMFSNFICDELDNIAHEDLLLDVKWEIQEIVRNAIKRDMMLTQQEQSRPITSAAVEVTTHDGNTQELLFNVEI